MEDNSPHTSDKKIFIITPEELAKLGILDTLTAEIKIKNTDKKLESPTASTSATKPEHLSKNDTDKLLLNLIKPSKVCNKPEDDKTVFKRPRNASNLREIKDHATITKFPQTVEEEIQITNNDIPMAKSPIIPSNKIKFTPKRAANIKEQIGGHDDKTEVYSSVSESKNTTRLISTSLKDKIKKNISNKEKVSTSEIKFNVDKSSEIRSKKNRPVPNLAKIASVGTHMSTTNTNISQNIQFTNKEETNTNIPSDIDATEKTKNKIVILENIKISGVHNTGISELFNKSSLVSKNEQNPTLTVDQDILENQIKTESEVIQISKNPEIITSKISLIQDDNNVNITNIDLTESIVNKTVEEQILPDYSSVELLDGSNNLKYFETSNILETGVLNCNNLRSITDATVESTKIVGLPINTTPQKEMHSKEISSENEELVIEKTATMCDVDKEKPSDMYLRPSTCLVPKKRGIRRKPSESSVYNDIVDKNANPEEKYDDFNKSSTEIEIKKEIETIKNTKSIKIESNLITNTLAGTVSKQKSLVGRKKQSSETVTNDDTNKVEKTVDIETINHKQFGPIKNVTKSENNSVSHNSKQFNVELDNPTQAVINISTKRDSLKKNSEGIKSEGEDNSFGVEHSSLKEAPTVEKGSSSDVNTDFKSVDVESNITQTIATPKKRGRPKKSSVDTLNVGKDTTISKSVHDDDGLEATATDPISIDPIKNNVTNSENNSVSDNSKQSNDKLDNLTQIPINISTKRDRSKKNSEAIKSEGEDNSFVVEYSSLKEVPTVEKESSSDVNTDFKSVEIESNLTQTIATPKKRGRPKKSSVDTPNVGKDTTISKSVHDDDGLEATATDPIPIDPIKNNVTNSEHNSFSDNSKQSNVKLDNLIEIPINISTKRGRSKKNSEGIKSEGEDNSFGVEHSSLKKAPTIEKESSSEINTDFNSVERLSKIDVESNLTQTIATPKKRGRPKKASVDTPNVGKDTTVSKSVQDEDGLKVTATDPIQLKSKGNDLKEKTYSTTELDQEKIEEQSLLKHNASESTITSSSSLPNKIKDGPEGRKSISSDYNKDVDIEKEKQIPYSKQGRRSRIPFRKSSQISMMVNSTDLPVKNKLGRPPKNLENNVDDISTKPDSTIENLAATTLNPENQSDVNNAGDNSTFEETSDISINTSTVTSEPHPKRTRGRKPKSEYVIAPREEPIELPMEKSTRGRRHVKINYLELENMFDGATDFMEQIEKKSDKDKPADASFNSSDVKPKKKRGRPRKSEITQPEDKKELAHLESVHSKPKDESTNKESEISTNKESDTVPVRHDDCLENKDYKERTYSTENSVEDLSELDLEKLEEQPLLKRIGYKRTFTSSNNKPLTCDTSNLPIKDESKEENSICDDYNYDEGIEKETEMPCVKQSSRWRIPYRKDNVELAIQRNKRLKLKLGRLHRKLDLQNNVENQVNAPLKLENQSEDDDRDNSTFEEKSNISLIISSNNSDSPLSHSEEKVESPMAKYVRGRKHNRTNYLELDSNIFDEDIKTKMKEPDEDNTQADTSFNSSDVIPKKKRGRKRKSELTLPEEKIETAERISCKVQDESNTASKVEENNDVPMNKKFESNLKPSEDSDEDNIKTSKKKLRRHQNEAEMNLPMDKSETSSTCNQSDPTEDSKNINQAHAVPSTSFESPSPAVKRRGRPRKDYSKYESQDDDIGLMELESKRECRPSVIDYSETENQLEDEIGYIKKRKRKISSSSDEEIIKGPIERVKYEYTGRYTKLINDVLAATVLKTHDTEASPNSNTSIQPQPRFCGRPRKNVEPSFNVDENGQVTCVPCQIKIPEEEWIDHNENKHGNLSWREGEQVVLLDQLANLKGKLKPLLIKNKSLTCTKCNQKLISIKDFISHTEECIGIVVNGDVTCSVCKKSMPKKSWSNHKIKHNNLAWRVGEHPLDLHNEAFVLQTLNAIYKARKPLYCDKCGTAKKSVVGLLSHLGQCGNTDNAKITCELCGKKMLPVSLPTHIKMVHEAPKKIEKVSDYFHVDLDVSQTKRKAATKAMVKIDEFASDTKETPRNFIKNMKFENNKALMAFINKELEENKFVKCKISTCEFFCAETLVMLSHLKDCSLKLDQRFTCKTCFFTEPTEDGIIDHLQTAHDIDIKKDEDYVYNEEDNNAFDLFLDNENSLERSLKRRSIAKTQSNKDISVIKLKPLFIHDVSKGKVANNFLFSHAFQYAFEFCEKNFHRKNLFDDLKCDRRFWNLIDDELLEEYVPSYELSCAVLVKNVNGMKNDNIFKSVDELKTYELFEAKQQNANITIFCGAPVRCLAWQPTPHKSSNEPQILAVATSKHFDEKYNHLEHYSETTVIQFWNFGLLQNCQKVDEPKIDFCLGVDNGPVWFMEWCPSGCYDAAASVQWSRRGLLAVAGHSMSVHIYSIPLLAEEQRGLFYKARPVLKLQIAKDDSNLKRLLFPTKISWSKVSGHSYIAVGYSDGTVALYNLDTSSKLLRFTDKSSEDVLLPYKILKTHSHVISGLYLIPIDVGNRWLLTSSFDKAIHLWDLYTDDKFSVIKGKLTSEVAWLTQWLCFISGGDESTAVGQAIVSSNNHREYLYDAHTLSYSLSTITSISSSDWLNAFVHGNETGEIVINLPHQMLYEMARLKKTNDYRYLIGYSRLIDKTLSPEESVAVEEEKKKAMKSLPRQRRSMQDARNENYIYHWYEPFEYEEAAEKYGVAFCDTVDMYKLSSDPDTERFKPNLYPLMAVNKISFNPNRQASLFFATGYQIGFVRVSYLKFLEKDPQIQRSKYCENKL